MKLPLPKAPARLKRLSPSRYNMAVVCPARALWGLALPSNSLPSSPGAVLGLAFHEVMEAANTGRLGGDEDQVRAEAGRLFDGEAQKQMNEAHPLLRAKFASPSRLPYYNQKRASVLVQAARRAAGNMASLPIASVATAHPSTHVGGPIVEQTFSSKDGLLNGKLDYFDPGSGLLTDYKSGAAPEDGGVSSDEARQLRFYAHLLFENGHTPREAAIVRTDGHEVRLPITSKEADEEGQAARRVLEQLNEAVEAGQGIEETAIPSPQNCSRCHFVPICPAFWEAASPDWTGTSSETTSEAVHVEGVVVGAASGTSVSGGGLTALRLDVSRGTGLRGIAALEQVPDSWLTCDDDRLPRIGDVVRVTSASLQGETPSAASPASLRTAQTRATGVWTLETDRDASSADGRTAHRRPMPVWRSFRYGRQPDSRTTAQKYVAHPQQRQQSRTDGA